MMLRRRMPIATPSPMYTPSSSGPRCAMTPHIARISSSRTGCPSQRTIPAIPHTVVLLHVRPKPDGTWSATLGLAEAGFHRYQGFGRVRLQADQVARAEIDDGVG